MTSVARASNYEVNVKPHADMMGSFSHASNATGFRTEGDMARLLRGSKSVATAAPMITPYIIASPGGYERCVKQIGAK
ncbi:hypothetical protein ABEF91_004809 [Exophiala dermatitidis]